MTADMACNTATLRLRYGRAFSPFVTTNYRIPGTAYITLDRKDAFARFIAWLDWHVSVIPGMPHHITQRGNRRQPTFFCEEDYAAYLELMGQWCKERGVDVWAYCLMPNHVHLDRGAEVGGRPAAGDRRGASALYAAGELPRAVARASLAGAFCLLRPGRAISVGGGALRGTQSGTRRPGRRAERLSLEQCAGSPEGQGRLLGARFRHCWRSRAIGVGS